MTPSVRALAEVHGRHSLQVARPRSLDAGGVQPSIFQVFHSLRSTPPESTSKFTMDSEDRQSPRPSLSSPDSAPMQRRSTDSEHPASEHVESIAQKRTSEDATPAIDAIPHTPETDGSPLSHQSPVSSPPALIHQTESSSDARDLGVDAGAPIIRVARPSSDSTLSMPSLMPIDEDRSDLWRNGHDPPTFRPRTENVDSGVQTTAVVNNNTEERIYAIPRPRRRGVRRVFAFFGYGTGNRHRKELVSLIWTISFGSIQVRMF